MSEQFNVARDMELIAKGSHFWCSGHLGAVSVDEQSVDSRYCRQCFEFLLGEAKLLKGTARPAWIPKINADKAPETRQKAPAPPVSVPEIHGRESHKELVTGILSHRGRGKKSLPVARIKELSSQGIASRDIAKQLGFEGVNVSYRTVSRTLAEVK